MTDDQRAALAAMGLKPSADIRAEKTAAFKALKGRGKLPRTKKGGMNKLEAAYADHLEGQKQRGEILDWWFQPFSLTLGEHAEEATDDGKTRQRGRYTPDFMVQTLDGYLEIHETKGSFWSDAALVRIKWAATKYHVFTFRVVTRKRKTDPWSFEEITG